MSRIGKNPVLIPKGVTITLDDNKKEINVKGPNGNLNLNYEKKIDEPDVHVKIEDDKIIVTRTSDDREARSKHGLVRALINNMVVGTTTGFKKELQIVGTGYRASLQGKQLVLNVGYSLPHPIDIPDTLKVEVDQKGLNIVITGADKQEVGQFAAIVREERMPEPYKQKGIRYKNEYIMKKQGKRGTK
jgi:large subunit ribosomal protein L6